MAEPARSIKEWRTPRDRERQRELAQSYWRSAVHELWAAKQISREQFFWLAKQVPVDLVRNELILGYRSESDVEAARQRSRPLNAMLRKLRDLAPAGPGLELNYRIARPPETEREREAARPAPPAPPLGKIGYLPNFLVATSLPHSRPSTNSATRSDGPFEVTLHAADPPGLPYGTTARLILIYLTTRSVRDGGGSRRFPLARSINDMLAAMGIADSGGGNGASTHARDQLRRLAATAFTFTPDGGRSGENILIADKWLSLDEHGLVITLSVPFVTAATKHAVPLDMRIIQQLRPRGSLALDLYAWLTYRVSRPVRPEGVSVPWEQLAAQFGADYKRPRGFREKAKKTIAAVQAAWPALNVQVTQSDLVIMPTPPSVPRGS